MNNASRIEDPIELTGTVTTGKGEGKFFVSLEGYAKQFQSKLGYEPFPGTLNLDLTADSVTRRANLSALDAICIDGWNSGDRTYGPVTCYPAHLVCDRRTADPVHVLVPKRTDHDEDQLEVIAPEKLRATYDLDDGERLTIRIGDHQ